MPLRSSRRSARPRLILTLATLLVLGATVVWASSFLLWSYNVQRAGAFMETALLWPDPRTSDALPQLGDAQAAEQALNHLTAAMQRRPNHAHAYRMAGQIYAAQGNWQRAAEMWERARVLSPKNPLLAWEASLVYERMVEMGEAPMTRVTDAWRDARMDAATFTRRGDLMRDLDRPEEAQRWYARAALAEAAQQD